MSELLPCWECGESDEYNVHVWQDSADGSGTGPSVYSVRCLCGVSAASFDTPEEAEENWSGMAKRFAEKTAPDLALNERIKELSDIAIELARDRHSKGKTILDFYAVWLTQERDKNAKQARALTQMRALIESEINWLDPTEFGISPAGAKDRARYLRAILPASPSDYGDAKEQADGIKPDDYEGGTR